MPAKRRHPSPFASAAILISAVVLSGCGNASEASDPAAPRESAVATPGNDESAAVTAISADATDAAAPGTQTPSDGQASAPAAAPEPDPAVAGRRAFAACATCHAVTDPAVKKPRRKIGPNLWNIVGAPAGADPDFKYSEKLLSSGVTWDEASLDAFLENPRSFMPGNRMSFPGERRAERRAAIIAYLKSQGAPTAE